MFVNKVFWLVSVFSFLWNFAYSQISVSIPNVAIERGRNDTISIFAQFQNASINKLNLVFQFNAYVLDIKKVVSGEKFIISDPSPNFNIQLNQLTDATISITSSNINVNSAKDSLLCQFIVEGLVYKDTLDTIKLVQIEIDDNQTNFVFNGGIVVVRGPTVFPVKKNYLSEAFPLPTTEQIYFRFGIVSPSYLEFVIYNSNGEKVLNSNDKSNIFRILGAKGEFSTKDKLEAGDYLLIVSLPQDLSSGSYFLELNAFSVGLFFSKFLIVK